MIDDLIIMMETAVVFVTLTFKILIKLRRGFFFLPLFLNRTCEGRRVRSVVGGPLHGKSSDKF